MRAAKILQPLPWVVIAVGLVLAELTRVVPALSGKLPEILLAALGVFFPLLIVQLVLAAVHQPRRRTALLILAASVVTWAMGSIWVNSASRASGAEFPAPGEWLFLVSYVGMAGYLLRDVARRPDRPARGWLDIVIICGAIACLASLMFVTPLQVATDREGASLLLALLYPLADLTLALLVLGQALLQVRVDRSRSWAIGLSFVLLAGADSAFVLQETAGDYAFDDLSYALWGIGFALLVGATCRPPSSAMRPAAKASATPVLVGAGLVAVAALALRPDGTVSAFVTPPAVLALAAVGARLALALRDANHANEAFALSQTDDLTLLPNRRAVRSWLADGLARRVPMALLLLDLDRFKEINDALGHRAGDTVLTLVAVKVREALDPGVRVARLGGDEFAIIVELTDEIELMEMAHLVLRNVAEPIAIEGMEISPAASIGITVARRSDVDGGDVLRRADVAMYQAKSAGQGVAVYDAELDDFSRSRLELAEELRRGLPAGQIEVWYQPQIDAMTREVVGLEALVRWRHPEQGLISPVSFLPAARRAGLMGELSEVVTRQAVADLERRAREGIDLTVAINCAPPELLGPTFLPCLYAAIEKRGVAADRLVVEVTEDSFLSDPIRARDVLTDLRSHGVQVSIDDYGTGFSSLTYLRNLPVQELKLDRSLVTDVASDQRSAMIVESTIALAHALDLRTVAEGIENAGDLDVLVGMGIDVLQGYYLGRPMPAGLVDQWISDYTRARGDNAQGRQEAP